MANETTNTTILDLGVEQSQLTAAFNGINSRIEQIAKKVTEISSRSEMGAKKFDETLRGTVKSLQTSLGQVAALEKLLAESTRQGSRGVRSTLSEQTLGKQTIAAANYRESLKGATTAMDALISRQNKMLQDAAKMGGSGIMPDKAFLREKSNIDSTIANLKKLEAEYDKLKQKAAKTGGDFSPQKSSFNNAREGLFSAIMSGKNSFGSEINTMMASLARFNADIERSNKSSTETAHVRQTLIKAELATETNLQGLISLRSLKQTELNAKYAAFLAAEASERNILGKSIADHETILKQIDRQIGAVKKLHAAEAGSPRNQNPSTAGRQDRSAVGNILSPHYAAAAFARTTVYGAAAGVAYKTFDALQSGIRFTLEFEDGLAKLQAISGSTETQMGRLSETILDVSKNSRFATAELVEASTVLAQAGLSTRDIADSLPAINDLAAASGSTLQQTTEVVTSALGAFQLSSSETGRIADVMTSALNNTKLNFSQLGLAIQYVGATAKEQNLSLEDLVATTAAMAQAGIRSGSTIGTGLRAFLVDLQTPTQKLSDTMRGLGLTFEDIDVKTRGLPAVLRTLTEAGFGSAQAYGTLETRAAAAYLTLRSNVDLIDKQTLAQNRSGTSALAAARAMDSLSAQWARFKNTTNASVASNSQGFLGFLKDTIRGINDSAEAFTRANAIRERYTRNGMITGEQQKKLAEEIKNDAAGYHMVTENVERYAAATEISSTQVSDATAAIDQQQVSLASVQQAIDIVNQRQSTLTDGSLALAAQTSTLMTRFSGLSQYLADAAGSYDGLTAALARYQAQARTAQIANLDSRIAGNEKNQSEAFKNTKVVLGQLRSLGLPKGVMSSVNALSSNPNGAKGEVYRNQVLDAARRYPVGSNERALLNQYAGSRADEVNAAFAVKDDTRQRQSLQYLSTPEGLAYQKMVSDLGKAKTSQGQIDTILGKLEVASKGNISPGKLQALAELSTQAQTYSGKSGALLDPKAARGNRAANQAARNETFTQKDLLQVVEKELSSYMKDANEAVTEDLYDQAVANTKKSLDEWEKTTMDVAKAEIAQKGMSETDGPGARLMAQTSREIAQKRKEVSEALADSFIKLLEAQLKVVDTAFNNAISKAEAQLSIAQGRLSGLDRYSLRNRVTEADRVLAQRDVSIQSEAADRARGDALGIKQGAYQTLVNDAQGKLTSLNASGDTAGAAKLTLELEDLKQKLQEVTNEKAALDAAFSAENELPTTFTGQLTRAVEAYKEANGLTKSVHEQIFSGLTGMIQNTHESFNTFFTDIITGTHSVGSAFGNMARSIMNYMAQMAAQAAANAIFGSILKAVGSAFGAPSMDGGGGGGGSSLFDIGNSLIGSFTHSGYYGGGLVSTGKPMMTGNWRTGIQLDPKMYYNGGEVKKYAGGGRVMNGSSAMDNVKALLSRGEWVVNRKAVNSVGNGFMADLNKRGAQALEGVKGQPMVVNQKPAITNVYVVKQDEKPQMGPNDVLVAVHDDILRNGATKKLIKQVAAGA